MTLNWLFIDMNSYFASVEQQFRPELRGRPVAVIPVESEHTCCIAASLQAKRHGVRTGTRVAEARRRCPDLVTVRARPAFYVQVHRRILAAIDRHAPIHKVYSIDEAAVRLVPGQQAPDAALDLARRIKAQIRHDVGPCLTASVGLAPTRLLAKIACDMHKPDGLTMLRGEDLPGPLLQLPLDHVPGIGANMMRRLHAAGIGNMQDLWPLSCNEVAALWGGVQGRHFWCGLHGMDTPEVPTHRGSMGHANVLAPRFRHEAGAHAMLTRLLHKAAFRLRHHGYWAHRLHVHVRYAAGGVWEGQAPLPGVQDTLTLAQAFEHLWRQPGRRRHRRDTPLKVGITLTGLTNAVSTTPPLDDSLRRRADLARAIDRINARHGEHTVYLGAIHDCRHIMDDKIAFGRVPDEAPPAEGRLSAPNRPGWP